MADLILSDSQIRSLFDMPSGFNVKNTGTPGVSVVDDPANSGRVDVFRVSFAEGFYGTKKGGGQWVTPILAADEYYLAYDLFVPTNFNWPPSSKLPGLFGGDLLYASGGAVPDGVRGFAARQACRSEKKPGETVGWSNIGDGTLGADLYYYNTSSKPQWYNTDLDNSSTGNVVRLIDGQWLRMEQHVVVNTATATEGQHSADGIYEAWVNGVLVREIDNLVWRTVNTLRIDGVSMIWWYGGSNDGWNARENQAWYFDNFIVSTSRITG